MYDVDINVRITTEFQGVKMERLQKIRNSGCLYCPGHELSLIYPFLVNLVLS